MSGPKKRVDLIRLGKAEGWPLPRYAEVKKMKSVFAVMNREEIKVVTGKKRIKFGVKRLLFVVDG